VTRDNGPLLTVFEQAAHWWVVCRDENVSAAERREFGEWVVRAPERVEAYLRLAGVHGALARSELRWPETPADRLIREAIGSQDEEPVPFHHARVRRKEDKSRRPAMALALAASVLAAILIGWFALLRPQHFETKFGEQRSVLLRDGSRVTLNTASAIEARMEKGRRAILLVRGEAFFEVAHDAARPFEVSAGNAVARAVGTQFNVDRRPDRTVVTVVEGRVAMRAASGASLPLPVLAVGDRAVVRGNEAGKVEHGVDVSEATAWTRRQIVVKGRPVGEVADEFNRYNLRRIDVRSPALRAEKVTATFQANDPASFVAFMQGIPGVRIADDGKGGYIATLDESDGRND
jgi:transmembrane sensor